VDKIDNLLIIEWLAGQGFTSRGSIGTCDFCEVAARYYYAADEVWWLCARHNRELTSARIAATAKGQEK
jgi:hypothetical protein